MSKATTRTTRTLAAGVATALALSLGASSCSDETKSSQVTDTTLPTTEQSQPSTSTTVPDTVIEVTTTTTASGTDSTTSTLVVPTGHRDLTAGVYWTRPVGGEPVSLPSYQDPSTEPLPLVVYGWLKNDGTVPLANPTVTAVWLDGSGKAVKLAEGRVVDPRGGTVTNLPPGAVVDVVVVVEAPDGVGLESLTTALIGKAA